MRKTCAQELKNARAEAAQQQDRAGSGGEASSSGSGEDSDGSQDNRERRKRSNKRGGKGKDRKEGKRTKEERRKLGPEGKKAKKRGREDKAEAKSVSFCAVDCCTVQLQAGTLTHGACRSPAPAQTRLASMVLYARLTWTGMMRVRLSLPERGLCLWACLFASRHQPSTSPACMRIAVLRPYTPVSSPAQQEVRVHHVGDGGQEGGH